MQVIHSNTPNAFVVPGGKVVVFTGLIDLLASEAEVAAVMAHETAHVLARHHVGVCILMEHACLQLL